MPPQLKKNIIRYGILSQNGKGIKILEPILRFKLLRDIVSNTRPLGPKKWKSGSYAIKTYRFRTSLYKYSEKRNNLVNALRMIRLKLVCSILFVKFHSLVVLLRHRERMRKRMKLEYWKGENVENQASNTELQGLGNALQKCYRTVFDSIENLQIFRSTQISFHVEKLVEVEMAPDIWLSHTCYYKRSSTQADNRRPSWSI